jgi:hypothetical protein
VLKGPPRVVGGNHVKVRLSQGDTEMDGIGFDMADRIDPGTWDRGLVDVAFQLQENEFRGVKSLEARMKVIRPSGAGD